MSNRILVVDSVFENVKLIERILQGYNVDGKMRMHISGKYNLAIIDHKYWEEIDFNRLFSR